MKTYTIRDLSKQFNLKTSTLRYYEDLGLLEGVVHDEHQRRVYHQKHIDRLAAIECFKQAKVPLQKILLFFQYEKDINGNIDQILDLVLSQKKELLEELEDLKSGLDHLEHKVRFYSKIKECIKDQKPWPNYDEV